MSRGKRRKRRLALAGSQAWRCCYCSGIMDMDGERAALATVDHVIPAATGGPTNFMNCVAACRGCNAARGVMRATRFWARRQAMLLAGVWPPCTSAPNKVKKQSLTRSAKGLIETLRLGCS